jgi:hydroxypyruvate isomerase
MEGDVIRTLRNNIKHIGHFHTAGNPDRNEIDESQELNYPAIMRAIAATNYDGYVGQEFSPVKDASVSLEMAVPDLRRVIFTENQQGWRQLLQPWRA